jgi:hypothetical protein
MTARVVRRWGQALAAVIVTVAAGLGGASAAAADDGSFGGTFYLADADTMADIPVGQSLHWDQAVTALPAPGDQTNKLLAPKGTQSVVTFVGPVGHESDPTSWNATAPWEYSAPGQWLTDVTPYHLIVPGSGNPSGTNAMAAASGDYSLGLAYLADGGKRVVPGGLYYVHIHLTGNADPSQASYTWQPVKRVAGASGSAGSGSGKGVARAAAGGVVVVAVLAGWMFVRRRRRGDVDGPASEPDADTGVAKTPAVSDGRR